MREIKVVFSRDGKRRFHLYDRADGFFSFDETYEAQEDLTEVGGPIETYWAEGYHSGIYESAQAAEREARVMLPWLQEISN